MNSIHYIDNQPLDLSDIQSIIINDKQIALSESAIQKIEK